MGLRRAGRELALQILYARDAGKLDLREVLRGFREGIPADENIREFAEELVKGVMQNQEEIDGAIKTCSKNWALGRMPKVDLNIMRLAAFELLFRADIPKKVSINEAIEIAKKYGDKESPAFVNGILDELKVCDKGEERSAV